MKNKNVLRGVECLNTVSVLISVHTNLSENALPDPSHRSGASVLVEHGKQSVILAFPWLHLILHPNKCCISQGCRDYHSERQDKNYGVGKHDFTELSVLKKTNKLTKKHGQKHCFFTLFYQ